MKFLATPLATFSLDMLHCFTPFSPKIGPFPWEIWTSSDTSFLGPTWSTTPNGISIEYAVFSKIHDRYQPTDERTDGQTERTRNLTCTNRALTLYLRRGLYIMVINSRTDRNIYIDETSVITHFRTSNLWTSKPFPRVAPLAMTLSDLESHSSIQAVTAAIFRMKLCNGSTALLTTCRPI